MPRYLLWRLPYLAVLQRRELGRHGSGWRQRRAGADLDADGEQSGEPAIHEFADILQHLWVRTII
jgi:hypothetical protein